METNPIKYTSTFEGKTLEWTATSEKKMTWKEANEYAKSLGDGWRLPTIKELFSIVNHEKYKPACDFKDTQSLGYWSATTYQYPGGEYFAWFVGFVDGNVYNGNKYYGYPVRLCREVPVDPSVI